jgi:addiction module RelB/DinJ family antitoxin
MNTTLQTRVDGKLKRDAKKALESMGLDLSTGVKLFLTQVVRTQSIPFEVFTADNLPEKVKRQMMREAGYALKYGKRYKTIQEAHRDVLGAS